MQPDSQESFQNSIYEYQAVAVLVAISKFRAKFMETNI